MMSFSEVCDNGIVLEWREHPLSGVVSLRGKENLVLEPALVNSSEKWRYCLQTRSDQKHRRVEWAWGKQWRRVEINPRGARDSKPIVRQSPDDPWVAWKDVPFCDLIEITPYDTRNWPGATERRRRPPDSYDDLISMRPNSNDKVRVELPESFKPADFFVQCYVLSGHGLTSWREMVPFEDHIVNVPVVRTEGEIRRGLVGYVCVIQRLGANNRLIACRDYDKRSGKFTSNGELLPPHEGHLQIIHATLEREGSAADAPTTRRHAIENWLALWPGRSKQLLKSLYDDALHSLHLGPTDAFELLRLKPKGLCRALILLSCDQRKRGGGDRPIEELNASIDELDSMTAQEVLQKLISPAPADVAAIPPEEMNWIINHQGDDVMEAFDWARGRGVDSLERALTLTPVRNRARRAKEELRKDSAEYEQAQELQKRIENALLNRDSIDGLQNEVSRISERIDQDKRKQIDPDDGPPITSVRHAAWQESRRRISSWCLKLSQVLTLCETGEWPTILADEPPSQEELEERLRRISAPERPHRSAESAKATAAAIASVDELLNDRPIQELLNNKTMKRRAAFYALAVTRLKTILSSAPCWAPLHQDIREAELRAESHRSWAELAGVFDRLSDINARVRAAHAFLDLLSEFEALVDAWSPLCFADADDRLARGTEEWRAILSQPHHTRIIDAHNRYLSHLEILGPRVRRAISLKRPPSAQAKRSLPSLRSWWKELQLLDQELDRLGVAIRTFEVEIKEQYRERHRPRIIALLERHRSGKQKPPYYEKLDSLYNRCETAGARVTRESIVALLRFIWETPGLELELRDATEGAVQGRQR
jgi:hypothetical protein